MLRFDRKQQNSVKQLSFDKTMKKEKKERKTKIMATGPITSWQIDGETMETVRVFIFLGSKITAEGDCSHEIKRQLVFGIKAMTNIDSISKSRAITL